MPPRCATPPSGHRCDAERAGQTPEARRRATRRCFVVTGGADIHTPTPITARQLEQILRDAGLPKAFVKALMAAGWKAAAGQDDADTDPEAVAALVRNIKAAAVRLEELCK